MSILDQTRTLPHLQGMPPGSQPLMPPHAMDGPPNSEVLLALLARNKALEGLTILNLYLYFVDIGFGNKQTNFFRIYQSAYLK